MFSQHTHPHTHTHTHMCMQQRMPDKKSGSNSNGSSDLAARLLRGTLPLVRCLSVRRWQTGRLAHLSECRERRRELEEVGGRQKERERLSERDSEKERERERVREGEGERKREKEGERVHSGSEICFFLHQLVLLQLRSRLHNLGLSEAAQCSQLTLSSLLSGGSRFSLQPAYIRYIQ